MRMRRYSTWLRTRAVKAQTPVLTSRAAPITPHQETQSKGHCQTTCSACRGLCLHCDLILSTWTASTTFCISLPYESPPTNSFSLLILLHPFSLVSEHFDPKQARWRHTWGILSACFLHRQELTLWPWHYLNYDKPVKSTEASLPLSL